MDVPTARRDKMIHVNEGRQQKAGEYAVQIAYKWLLRQNDNQHPR